MNKNKWEKWIVDKETSDEINEFVEKPYNDKENYLIPIGTTIWNNEETEDAIVKIEGKNYKYCPCQSQDSGFWVEKTFNTLEKAMEHGRKENV